MPNLVLVHGTWGRAQPWHFPGSALRLEAHAQGYEVWDFLWSGLLAGIPTELPGDPLDAAVGADNGQLLPWLDAGEKLVLQLQAWGIFEDPALCLLTHSHGLQVGTYAVIRGARFRRWVSVSGPVRRDMLRARRRARDGVGKWLQFADPSGADHVIVAGELELGVFGPLAFDLPDGGTIHTPGTGHSGLLNDPDLRVKYQLWGGFA